MAVARDTITLDSALQDTLTIDTTPRDTSYVIVMDVPESPQLPTYHHGEERATSWLLLALLALFVTVAVRYRKNSKYISAIFKELTNVRERGNMLDNTVREVSFLMILNFVWALSAGILLYGAISGGGEDMVGAGMCVGCALVYEIAMTAAYLICGNVFSDARHARLWVRGFWAAQSLSAAVMFPMAVLLVCYPGNAAWGVAIGWIGYLIAKILYIWKGFRIFFTQMSSWVLFLYYLCSLEIVPVVITLYTACRLTGITL